MGENKHNYGILENFKELGVGIVEFAIDDYISTVRGLCTCYKKLDRSFEEGFKARKYHERQGDVILSIYHKIQNLNDIEKFLTGSWVRKLTDMDVDMIFRETKNILRQKGHKVGLMSLTVKTDDKGVRVYANEKDGAYGKYTLYSLGISTRNKDGSWDNGYINCKFKKGISVPNKSKIKINNAFFTASKSGDKTYTNLMITDFDILEGETAAGEAEEFMKIPETDDSEVPFL